MAQIVNKLERQVSIVIYDIRICEILRCLIGLNLGHLHRPYTTESRQSHSFFIGKSFPNLFG